MSKPKMLGYFKPYKPNNRADFRNRKRGRNPADRAKSTSNAITDRKGKEVSA